MNPQCSDRGRTSPWLWPWHIFCQAVRMPSFSRVRARVVSGDCPFRLCSRTFGLSFLPGVTAAFTQPLVGVQLPGHGTHTCLSRVVAGLRGRGLHPFTSNTSAQPVPDVGGDHSQRQDPPASCAARLAPVCVVASGIELATFGLRGRCSKTVVFSLLFCLILTCLLCHLPL